MIVIFPFSHLDQDLALENAKWMNELGGCKGHSVLVVHDKRCNPGTVESIRIELTKAFDHIYRADAAAEIDGWPQGANYFFRLACTWLQNKPEWPYFFWMEPDAIPLRKGWLDAIQEAHTKSGLPFTGDRVQVENIPLHMSGIGVYPNPIFNYAGEAYRAMDIAWDMAAREQIIPRANFTKLIEHAWKHPSFTDLSELQTQIRPEAVLFHSSKDGSLIDLLRRKLSGSVAQQSASSPPVEGAGVPFDSVIPAVSVAVPAQTNLTAVPYERRDSQGQMPEVRSANDPEAQTGKKNATSLPEVREREASGMEAQRALGENYSESETQSASGIKRSGDKRQDSEADSVSKVRGNSSTDSHSRSSLELRTQTQGGLAVQEVPPSGTFDCRDLVLAQHESGVGAQFATDGREAPKSVAREGANNRDQVTNLESPDSRGGSQSFKSQERPEVAGAPTSPILADIWNSGKTEFVLQHALKDFTTNPITDIFIRTYPGDFLWLTYCVRSIRLFASGFRKIWIITPSGVKAEVFGYYDDARDFEWKVMNDESPDGYLAQQITKLYADVITDYQPDYILHVDSDVILTMPVTPNDFMLDGKPTWFFTPYSQIETPWQPITEKFMGDKVENEFMRRFPIMVPRWLYPRLREFCYKRHGATISDYVRNQPHRAFSEFNALGAYAYKFHRDRFEFENTMDWKTMPVPYARQFHSWGGITDEVKAEISKIFEGDGERKLAGAPVPDRSEAANHDAIIQRHDPSPSETIPKGIRELPSGIWVIEDDTHISKWVEQQERLDHDQNLLPFILPEIRKGDTVIDAGAFIGDHTIAYSVTVGTRGIVHAFEPNPIAYRCLEHNMEARENVVMHNVGLSNASGSIPLSGNNNNYGGCYAGEHMKIATVPVQTIDQYFCDIHVDLIKLDIEGCEVKALIGMVKTIKHSRPKLVIEINVEALRRQGNYPGEIFSFLENEGYKWKILQENCGKTDPMYDILAIPAPPEVLSPSPEKENQRLDSFPTDPPVAPLSEMQRAVLLLKEIALRDTNSRLRVMRNLSAAGLTPRWPKKKKKKKATK